MTTNIETGSIVIKLEKEKLIRNDLPESIRNKYKNMRVLDLNCETWVHAPGLQFYSCTPADLKHTDGSPIPVNDSGFYFTDKDILLTRGQHICFPHGNSPIHPELVINNTSRPYNKKK